MAVLLALVVPRVRARRHRLPALLAAIGTVVGAGLPFGIGILLGVAVGLAPTVLFDRSEP